MSILYPGTPTTPAFDTFNVPTLPEETPLSQAGPGNDRNFPELAEDLGDAVEVLQRGASYRDHDHSGDNGHIRKGTRLKQVNTHEEVDTDAAPGAIHHTIGPGGNQAAAGNHTHDYNGSSILNVPYKICTSTTRPGQPVQGMIIYETDTKSFRQWDLYANNVVVEGLNVTYDFNTPSTLLIGGGGWTQQYSLGNTTNGVMATPAGLLRWIDNGNNTNVGWARRTGSNATTQTDDQVFTWKTGTNVVQSAGLLDEGATNDFYFRVSSDEQSYIRLRVGDNYLKVFYTTTGRANEKHLGTMDDVEATRTNTEWRAQMVDRTLSIYRAGEFMGAVKDNQLATNKGANFRGYMIGMQAGRQLFGQTTPGDIDWFRVQDLRYYTSTSRWTLLNLGTIPTVRLRQGKKQRLLNTGTILEWSTEVEDNFDFFNKNASQTDIIIKEAGRYRFNVALQWDTQFVPDIGHVVILVNGLETEYRSSKFLRGNSYYPGFSQTLDFTGVMRLAESDIVSVKCFYVPRNNLVDPIFSWFDLPSRVDSRFELTFEGP